MERAYFSEKTPSIDKAVKLGSNNRQHFGAFHWCNNWQMDMEAWGKAHNNEMGKAHCMEVTEPISKFHSGMLKYKEKKLLYLSYLRTHFTLVFSSRRSIRWMRVNMTTIVIA